MQLRARIPMEYHYKAFQCRILYIMGNREHFKGEYIVMPTLDYKMLLNVLIAAFPNTLTNDNARFNPRFILISVVMLLFHCRLPNYVETTSRYTYQHNQMQSREKCAKNRKLIKPHTQSII